MLKHTFMNPMKSLLLKRGNCSHVQYRKNNNSVKNLRHIDLKNEIFSKKEITT